MSGYLRLVYVSKASESFDRETLSELLETAKTKNALLGVTGMLCAGQGYFLQTIEGMEDRVIELYARIQQDVRHRDCALLDIGLVDSPMFENWAMGFVDGDLAVPQLFQNMLELRSSSGRRERTRVLMQNFLEQLRGKTIR